MTEARIKLQDEVVILAEYDEEVHAFLVIREVLRPDLVPPAFVDASGSVLRRLVQDWWYGRAIPMTREGYEEIRNALGDRSPMSLVEDSMGLSLSDQFWVDFGRKETSWEDVNFFDNDWDGQLSLLTAGLARLGRFMMGGASYSRRGPGPFARSRSTRP